MTDNFQYICVLDFEATCDSDRDNLKPSNEVIEFPSVLLKWNAEEKKYVKISEIQLFCKPLFNVQLTKFCKKLTGITQEQVNAGINFPDALKLHHNWLMTTTKMYEDENATVAIATCGDWDMKTMMTMECKMWDINPPAVYKKWMNVKDGYTAIFNTKKGGMVVMLEACGLELEGRHHSGYWDCVNISKIVQYLSNKGFKWNESVIKESEKHMYTVKSLTKKAINNKQQVKERLKQ